MHDPTTLNMISSYNWAYSNQITNQSITTVNLTGPVLRYQLAKMIVQYHNLISGAVLSYHTVVLAGAPNTFTYPDSNCNINSFSDHATFDPQMASYINTICDMKLMGWNGTQSATIATFNPYGPVTPADFTTISTRYIR